MKSRYERTFFLACSSLARTSVNASFREEKAARLMELNSYLCGGSYDE
jgi:hypothetical protein